MTADTKELCWPKSEEDLHLFVLKSCLHILVESAYRLTTNTNRFSMKCKHLFDRGKKRHYSLYKSPIDSFETVFNFKLADSWTQTTIVFRPAGLILGSMLFYFVTFKEKMAEYLDISIVYVIAFLHNAYCSTIHIIRHFMIFFLFSVGDDIIFEQLLYKKQRAHLINN